MTTKKFVSWAIVGIVGLWLFKKSRAIYQRRNNWDYNIKSFKLKGISAQKILLTFDVDFINKIGLGATIRNIKLKFFIQDTLLGDCYVPTSYEIPAEGSLMIPIDVLIDVPSLKGNLIYVVNALKQEGDFPVRIQGTFDSKLPFENWLTIPVDFSTTARYIYSLFTD